MVSYRDNYTNQMYTKLPGAAYDNKIVCKFAKSSIEKKLVNREALIKEYNLDCGRKDLLLGIVVELSDKNHAEVFLQIVEGLMTLGVCLAVRALGSKKFQTKLGQLAEIYAEKIALIPDGDAELRQILASSDVVLFFGQGEENEELALASLRYASLPIAPASFQHIVQSYNPNQESGNGFLYDDNNPWAAFAAVVRAVENFKFPYDWKTLQRSAIGG